MLREHGDTEIGNIYELEMVGNWNLALRRAYILEGPGGINLDLIGRFY